MDTKNVLGKLLWSNSNIRIVFIVYKELQICDIKWDIKNPRNINACIFSYKKCLQCEIPDLRKQSISSPSPSPARLIAEADKAILCGCEPQVCVPPRPVIIYSFCLIRGRVPPLDRIIFRLWQTRWQRALSLKYQRSRSLAAHFLSFGEFHKTKLGILKKNTFIHSERELLL